MKKFSEKLTIDKYSYKLEDRRDDYWIIRVYESGFEELAVKVSKSSKDKLDFNPYQLAKDILKMLKTS